ncbi:hypothetical protein MBLNU459_g1404t1 [Dothideomycetes sp. NU459]
MAPVTRRAANADAAKAVHRKRVEQPGIPEDVVPSREPSDSWELLAPPRQERANTSTDRIIDDINPLRDMADRVGREVDSFAETLDKYNEVLRGEDAYNAAHDLTVEYKAFANDMVKKLKKRHEAQRLHSGKNEFGKTIPGAGLASTRASNALTMTSSEDDDLAAQTSAETLKQWQVEADTWELFRTMLELRYAPQHDHLVQDRKATLAQMETPNRYTTEATLWERFTVENDVARERHLVLKWLQSSADHDDSGTEASTEDFEGRFGRGSGLWTNGWMETREKIKGAKRTRILSATTPAQLDVRRSDNNELVVSALDPDAPTRQQRTLEKADADLERSLWITCWKMLRRGKSWSEVYDWCAERNQHWRATSMGVVAEAALDVAMPGSSAGSLWRRMCYALARNGTSDDYEAAVYGMLSGDLDTVTRVCRTWDDHLYAHYNSLLLTQFDQFLQQTFPDKTTKRFNLFDAVQYHGDNGTAHELIETLRGDKSIAGEAQQPMKLVQSSLIANTFESLCVNLATAISDMAWFESSSTTIIPVRRAVSPESPDFLPEGAITDDYSALRIVTHVLIMLREFHKPVSRTAADADVLDNVIASYIQFLRVTGKRDLTPLYASKMSLDRGKNSLAQVISDIQDVQEKVQFIKLMDIYGIDPIAVLVDQTHYLMHESVPDRKPNEAYLHVLEPTTEEIYPGQRIKLDFSAQGNGGDGIADNLLVFQIIEGQWGITFETLAYALRKLLLNGCFLEASYLVRRMPFEVLSGTKSRQILGRSLNVMDRDEAMLFLANREQASTLRLLQKQAQVYYELCLLVRSLNALESWRQVEDEFTRRVPRPSSLPTKVKRSFEETCSAIEPVLTGLLLTSKDEDEAQDLAQIRSRFLPEIVIAYNAVLCAGGHMISRDSLMRSMELANMVADEKNGLAEAFVEAGRMRELVTAFARSSEIMLKLNEVGKARKEKKSKTGSNLAVWEIGG